MSDAKIKTIIGNMEEFDDKVNEFGKTHNVFATQTHITPTGWYVAVCFYREEQK